MEPLVGVEPTTHGLQDRCSTNWAKVAEKRGHCIENNLFVKIFKKIDLNSFWYTMQIYLFSFPIKDHERYIQWLQKRTIS